MSIFQVGRSPIMKKISNVLALKYRPQIFKDLVGHDEVARAIYNSIKNEKTSNAYLFTGIRGIGKTTFARIVAKALNCKYGIEKLCNINFCSNCESIINSNHIDVLEIDAASKTGVDDVRELIEFSRYAPSISKYKIFIIDEVHMLSKQAFNALLKTLEEPPKYLKFIFATTEIKKVPITVISRCQRYNLSRIRSDDLFEYLKKIGQDENRTIEENALKLIVKISEGSVRDALSLLDRALISNNNNPLDFDTVQKIFGYVDKSSYLDLLEFIFNGNEKNVIDHYKKIYDSGVEPNIFLNEFLEVLYFLKNISFIKVEGTNFSLNDYDYKRIVSLAKKIEPNDILLFWEFTLKTIKEIHIVSNPHLSLEMFLIQLIYIKNKFSLKNTDKEHKQTKKIINNEENLMKKNDLISQIKNIKQTDEKPEKKNNEGLINPQSLEDIIKICLEKKEMRLKYELENHVNLVSFTNNIIEISFNEKLGKDFVKELSEKLFNWTNSRWIISFSKKKGEVTRKISKDQIKQDKINEFKKTEDYLELLQNFEDVELIDIEEKND